MYIPHYCSRSNMYSLYKRIRILYQRRSMAKQFDMIPLGHEVFVSRFEEVHRQRDTTKLPHRFE